MLILRTNPMKHISLRIEEIPQYHDYYDKMENIYYNKESESKEQLEFFLYILPLIKINHISKTKPKKIPFKLLAFLVQVQNILSLEKIYEKAIEAIGCKKEDLSFQEFKFILKRTENWLNEVKNMIELMEDKKRKREILNKIEIFYISEKLGKKILNNLDQKQIKGLLLFKEFIINNQELDSDQIQNKIFLIAKQELKIPPRKIFEAIYLIILGKKSGPRLGSFIEMLDRDWLLMRLNQFIV